MIPVSLVARHIALTQRVLIAMKRVAGPFAFAEVFAMSLVCPRFRNNQRLQSASENAPALRRGETSDGVSALQRALVDLGHPMPVSTKEDHFDGIYGQETFSAVLSFQREHGLDADGIAGRQTLSSMDRIFLVNDSHFKDPDVERAAMLALMSGPPGRGPMSCTTARKNKV